MKTTKHTFFCSNISDSQLSEEESHHASRVLRLKNSDLITIIDGNGQSVIAEIVEITKKVVRFTIIESITKEKVLPEIHIAIAPTKSNDRFEYFLEKVTELGISEVTPILCSNSERKNIKLDRFEKIVMSATKQSGNLFLPKVNPMLKITDFLSQLDSETSYFIAHCEDDSIKVELKHVLDNTKKVCILIGPEGDFTNEEINLAKDKKIKPVSLGETRLRTETAGVIACHTVKIILN